MLRRVKAACLRIAQSISKPVAVRRSTSLSVLPLEERATPAVLTPVQPESVLMATLPTAPVIVHATAVRSDLFGVGDAGTAAQTDELETMLADVHAGRQTPVAAPPAPALDSGEACEGETVIIDNMVFLPQPN